MFAHTPPPSSRLLRARPEYHARLEYHAREYHAREYHASRIAASSGRQLARQLASRSPDTGHKSFSLTSFDHSS